MPLREILRYPDPRLREPSKPVQDPQDPALRKLVDEMAETMYAASGAGLAAIQVGVPLRLFIVDAAIAGGDEADPVLTFINPELTWRSDETECGDEGCLSFPGIYVPITRALRAGIRATNLDGEVFEMEGEGLLARAFQHESDHLDAKLLSDYVGRLKRQLIERRLRREQSEQD